MLSDDSLDLRYGLALGYTKYSFSTELGDDIPKGEYWIWFLLYLSIMVWIRSESSSYSGTRSCTIITVELTFDSFSSEGDFCGKDGDGIIYIALLNFVGDYSLVWNFSFFFLMKIFPVLGSS
jgi:hypothetical protein